MTPLNRATRLSSPELAVTRAGPPLRVRLPAGGWQVSFQAQHDGRTVIEVTGQDGSLAGLVASSRLPILSVDAGWGGAAKVVSGTVRDSLHMVDVIFGLDGGQLPEIVVSDTGSYSDVVFGLLGLLGIFYRPALADLPDQKGWRIKGDADYGPLNRRTRRRGHHVRE
jgi:hypothetical protein